MQLKFEGVDYFADVWLNGVKIGHHEGYFQPFMFDITDHINYEGRNFLAIRVESRDEDAEAECARAEPPQSSHRVGKEGDGQKINPRNP